MCTVTWQILDDGWLLFANRDEMRTRLPAKPPRTIAVDSVRVLAPIDGDAGGTWIGVNEHGVCVALLNGAPRHGEGGQAGFTSRGLLVLALLTARSALAVETRVREGDLDAYRGFRLLVLDRDGRRSVLVWDGHGLVAQERPLPPLVSSMRAPDPARQTREETWQRQLTKTAAGDASSLLSFHRSHEPERGPWSVCMHRKDASTVSLSRILVRGGEARFAYAAGPPCRTALGEDLVLPLLGVAEG